MPSNRRGHGPRGQRRVDGVESSRHRTDAATEARRVDGVGRPKFDFHSGLHEPEQQIHGPGVALVFFIIFQDEVDARKLPHHIQAVALRRAVINNNHSTNERMIHNITLEHSD